VRVLPPSLADVVDERFEPVVAGTGALPGDAAAAGVDAVVLRSWPRCRAIAEIVQPFAWNA